MSAKATARCATFLTANDVARLCHVDLKTIHNWAGKQKIVHHRTPGRHLRFRRLDVVDFLHAYDHPVPASLVLPRPRVCVVDSDAQALAAARRVVIRGGCARATHASAALSGLRGTP